MAVSSEDMTWLSAVLKVCSVGGEEEGRQHGQMGWRSDAQVYKLMYCGHLHVLQYGLQQPGLDGVEGAGGGIWLHRPAQHRADMWTVGVL